MRTACERERARTERRGRRRQTMRPPPRAARPPAAPFVRPRTRRPVEFPSPAHAPLRLPGGRGAPRGGGPRRGEEEGPLPRPPGPRWKRPLAHTLPPEPPLMRAASRPAAPGGRPPALPSSPARPEEGQRRPWRSPSRLRGRGASPTTLIRFWL